VKLADWSRWWSAGLVAAVAASAAPTRQAVPFSRYAIDDAFWSPRVRQIQEVTVPDLLDLAEEQGKIDNFRIVAGRKAGRYRTYNAADSDVYKLIEAAAYTLAWRRAPALEARLDEIIAEIVAAQQPDGYLNTQFTLPAGHPAAPPADARFVRTFGFGPEGRWASRADNWPRNYAQLYCAGHLFEAAVAYRAATGKEVLFAAAERLADHLVRQFPVTGRLDYADHPGVEIGLMRMFEATGHRTYLALADHLARFATFARPPDLGDGANRRPLAEQRVAWGHAVRTAYVYTGATDVIRHTAAADLRAAIDALWHSVVDSRLYVHGGVGGPAAAEQLQPPWVLDSAHTYSESCANIAHGQWNHSLNLLTGEARYAALVEHEMYNGALAGLGADGRTFFYSNLLAAGTAVRRNEHSGVRRRYLFCCPSKVPGFVAGVGRWALATAEGAVIVNQLVGGHAAVEVPGAGVMKVRIHSGFPWQGRAEIEVEAAPTGEVEIAVRVPGWALGEPMPGRIYRYAEPPGVTGQVLVGETGVPVGADGYARTRRIWQPGDRVVMTASMEPRRVVADPRAEKLRGRVAVMLGPVIYCLEQIDHDGRRVTEAALPRGVPLRAVWRPELLGGVMTVVADGAERLTFVPYHAWQNRGVGEMNVWVAEDTTSAAPLDLPKAEQPRNTKG
jgi:DUF1680 family protein